MIVKEADPWTVMCSYNRINGIYASENYFLLSEILKNEWGYEGVVVSDWGANHTIVESVEGGLDIEMPGPAKYYGNLLVDAVNTWQVDEAEIDKAARRLLKMILKSGKMDTSINLTQGSVNTKEHQLLAKEVAEEAITLLKNDGDILPLDRSKVKTIAVLGPNAADFPVSGGGSSSLEPPYRVSPLQGLLNKVNGEVTIFYEPGCDNFVDLPILKGEKIQPAQGQGFGLNGKYYNNLNFTGNPVLERIDDRFNFWWFEQGPSKELGNQFSACWTGKIVVQQSGLHTLGLANTGIGRIYIDGNLLFENHPDNMAKETTIKSEQQTIELDSEAKI